MTPQPASPEERFRPVFAHLQAVASYARRRGSTDPEGIAAEVMTIAWRRLDAVSAENPRPWLFVTARNLLMAERRRTQRFAHVDPDGVAAEDVPFAETGDGAVTSALLDLSPADREALLLVAWDDLTPAQAAETLDISPVAFRVRLFRARRRFRRAMAASDATTTPDAIGLEST